MRMPYLLNIQWQMAGLTPNRTQWAATSLCHKELYLYSVLCSLLNVSGNMQDALRHLSVILSLSGGLAQVMTTRLHSSAVVTRMIQEQDD